MGDRLLRLLAPGEDRFNRVELLLRDLPPLVLGALAFLVIAGTVMSVVAIVRGGRGPRLRLVLLRVVAGLLLLVLVLGPALELERATRVPSRAVVLVDVSRSMALPEGQGSRIERARALAARAVEDLRKRFSVSVYAFDGSLHPLEPQALARLEAGTGRTDIAGALEALRDRSGEGELAGIVLVTDGADTERLKSSEDIARRFGSPDAGAGGWTGAPVFPVLAGDPSGFRDLALVELRHDRFGFARHELTFDVKLVARGLAGRTAEVTLRQDGSPLTTRSVKLGGDGQALPLAFKVKPEKPGTYLYSIEAAPLLGEAVVENNKVELAVTIARDQVRVLLICGRPSWDERFLRQLLKKDPNVDLVSFFILRDDEDAAGVSQDELSLIPFPVNELFTTELRNFDVVILQNFRRIVSRQLALTNLHLENLREFVVKQGGGLLLVGGDLGMRSGGYEGTPIEDVLPFSLAGQGGSVDEASFRPRLTAAGETHFITGLEPEVSATRALFEGLPALDGTNLVGPLAPGAQALLAHPSITVGGAPMAVLAARSVGKGRTLGLTVDTSWYWNFKAVGAGGENRDYLRFWQNAVRWLASDPSSKFVSVAVAPDRLEPGGRETVRVRALKGDYGPLEGARVRVDVKPLSTPAPGETREGTTDATGSFATELAPQAEGFYRVRGSLLDSQGQAFDHDEKLFEVRADPAETSDPGLRPDLLEALARATGGRLIAAEEAAAPPVPDRAVYRTGDRRRIELWDNVPVYALLTAALALEWWLRRGFGLR